MKRETEEGTLRFAVADRGNEFLATRDLGRECRARLEAEFARRRDVEVLVIDFSNVEAMTISFADELVGNFYATQATGAAADRLIVLDGLKDDPEETVSVCLQRRDQIAVVQRTGGLDLLGAPTHLVETYERARALGEFSALQLAESLEVTPQNINNRLRRLLAGGALMRRRLPSEHGGKEFSYRAMADRTPSRRPARAVATTRATLPGSTSTPRRSTRQRNPRLA